MENWGKKSGNIAFLVVVWLGGKREKKNLVGPSVFSLDPPKCFLPEIGRKLGGEKLKVWANQNAHVHLHMGQGFFLALFLPVFFFLWFLFLWLSLSSSFPFFSFILFHYFFFFFFWCLSSFGLCYLLLFFLSVHAQFF